MLAFSLNVFTFTCLTCLSAGARNVRDGKSNSKKKEAEVPSFGERGESAVPDLSNSVHMQEEKALERSEHGTAGIKKNIKEYCVSTHLVGGIAKSEAFQIQL